MEPEEVLIDTCVLIDFSRRREEAHRFLVMALARPLSETPEAPAGALSQADRAITETLEFHAHVRLRRVA